VIRAGAIYSMAPDRAVYRAIALRDEWIVAVAADAHGLDGLVTADTRVLDDQRLTLLPAFYDTHNHLREATHNLTFVPVERARSVAEFVDLIRARAAQTPPGEWVQTSNAWHERNLAEQRLPTVRDLDAATTAHPVLARRGGHLAIANSLALQRGGITQDTANPPGGTIGRFPDGSLNGILEGGAVYALARVIPPQPFEQQVASIEQASRSYAAVGLGAVRDPIVVRDDLPLYQAVQERGGLSTRCRLMLLVFPAGSVADRIRQIEGYGVRSGFGDDWLRLWGLKFVMDGGPEGGALDAPYASDPTYTGHLNWDPDEMVAVAGAAVKRGWKIGTHAIGDRAVRTLLDVYERVSAANPGLPAGTLVMEHGFLADATQRARAIKLGVFVTVQHPLLYALGGALVKFWGPERTRAIMPVKSWLAEGGQLSAGTDYPISSYDPMQAIWGFVTRATEQVGVQGPEEAIDQYTAVQLYTVGGAQLDGESQRRGMLQAGKLADVVAFRADPITCPVDDLRALRPAFTVVGGRAVFDPDGQLS
jgi:predicted amidohydrolase YtcJ